MQASDETVAGMHWSANMKLRGYLEQLLEGSYGLLMGTVRKLLEPGLGISRLDRDDFLRFINFAKLCTSFVRQKEVYSINNMP